MNKKFLITVLMFGLLVLTSINLSANDEAATPAPEVEAKEEAHTSTHSNDEEEVVPAEAPAPVEAIAPAAAKEEAAPVLHNEVKEEKPASKEGEGKVKEESVNDILQEDAE